MATVSEIVFDALPRLIGTKPTGTTIYQAINYISSMLARRLIHKRSELAITPHQWDVSDGGQMFDLPSGFVSLAEQPFHTANGQTRGIAPLDVARSSYAGIIAQAPVKYELVGQEIAFYPEMEAVAGAVVNARCRTLPSPVSAPMAGNPLAAVTDPFSGMFDQVYFQGVPRVVAKGLEVVQADLDFEAFVIAEVDAVLVARQQPVRDVRTSRRNFL